MIFFFLSFSLLFSYLLLLLLLPFSSLLSYLFLLSFSKTKMRYLFWSYPHLILSPFYFTFSLFWSFLDHPVKVRKFPSSFLQATCLFHNFLPYFILIYSFYYSLVLQLSITLNLTYAYSYFGIDFTLNFCINSGFLLILFLSLFYSKKNILLLLLYPKHVIKPLEYNLGCYNSPPPVKRISSSKFILCHLHVLCQVLYFHVIYRWHFLYFLFIWLSWSMTLTSDQFLRIRSR